jgi:hypothetical protein
MKIKSLLSALLLSSVAANASITISGTSIVNSGILGYSTGVFVASTSSAFDVTLFDYSESLDSGLSFTKGTSFNGYTVLGSAAIFDGGPNGVIGSGVNYDLVGGSVAIGNEIGVLAFSTSSTETIAGDTFQVFTGGWVVPADGVNASLTGTGTPSFAGSLGTGTVVNVPEPSAYALLGGLLALTCVMLRRRA